MRLFKGFKTVEGEGRTHFIVAGATKKDVAQQMGLTYHEMDNLKMQSGKDRETQPAKEALAEAYVPWFYFEHVSDDMPGEWLPLDAKPTATKQERTEARAARKAAAKQEAHETRIRQIAEWLGKALDTWMHNEKEFYYLRQDIAATLPSEGLGGFERTVSILLDIIRDQIRDNVEQATRERFAGNDRLVHAAIDRLNASYSVVSRMHDSTDRIMDKVLETPHDPLDDRFGDRLAETALKYVQYLPSNVGLDRILREEADYQRELTKHLAAKDDA